MMAANTNLRGVLQAGGILDRIVETKARRLADVKGERPLAHLISLASEVLDVRDTRSMSRSLSRPGFTNIIAEIKHRSPSKGVIRADFDPVNIATSYERGGASALSVLTEEDFFGGSLDHLRAVRASVDLPLLRKDFVFDSYQVYEAVEAGADTVLLIVALLDDSLLTELISLASELKIDALVEVHTAGEMARAADAGARLIGVNNRDLTTFNVALETSEQLAPLAPPGAILVSESGINTREDIDRLKRAGYQAFLVGEHFMRAVDPGEALSRLIATPLEAETRRLASEQG